MSADLEALAARVEGVDGPSREVDAAIDRALSGNPSGHWYYSFNGLYQTNDLVPQYSASLDAAVMLVPEGWSFEVRRSGIGDPGQASVWNPMRAPGHEEYRVTGCATPALALCAAALRARAAEGRG